MSFVLLHHVAILHLSFFHVGEMVDWSVGRGGRERGGERMLRGGREGERERGMERER